LWVVAAAAIAPQLAGLVPRHLVPEVVLLLGAGMLLGPYGWGLASEDSAIALLSELGLAMLFLLAGYEIKPRELTGPDGIRALATWVLCLCLALGVTVALRVTDVAWTEVALAIALTSTALGTLLPILRDTGRMGGRVGGAVLRHGAYGELGPVVAMAVFLGARGPWLSLLVLALFGGIAVLLSLPLMRLRHGTSRLTELIRRGSETTGQIPVRLTLLLLVSLIVLADLFELEVVLAAFAAGFILRLALPSGDDRLETKLDGLSFGLLIPVFFVTSGMSVDPAAVAESPGSFVAIVAAILAVRGLPVLAASRLAPPSSRLGWRDSAGVALFAATGLPIIVAVTSLAVDAGEMSAQSASLLVAGGAATVLTCPLLASLTLGRPALPVDGTRVED
jgi:Kef-type K+ transport system membrane component KefB